RHVGLRGRLYQAVETAGRQHQIPLGDQSAESVWRGLGRYKIDGLQSVWSGDHHVSGQEEKLGHTVACGSTQDEQRESTGIRDVPESLEAREHHEAVDRETI